MSWGLKHVRYSQQGFTLIELLLALAVFAYAASSVMQLVGQSARNLSQLEEMTFASYVANNRLAELQVSPVWPPKNKDKGEVELAGKAWFWQQKVEETADKHLREITVQVASDKSMENTVFSLTSFVSQYQVEDKP